MSWHCSLELVEEFSQAKVWVTGSCVRWKKIRTAERSLCGVKKIKASQSSPSGTTLTPSTGTPGMALSMSFLLDFHAKDSPLQESSLEQTTPETSGQPQQGSSEKYVQAELFSKTSPEFESTSQSWPETLPIWGMTLNGELSQLEKPELDISANDGGAWPTPRANEPGRTTKGYGRGLAELVEGKKQLEKNWPTPNAHEPRLGYQDRSKGKKGSQKSLTTIVVDDNGGPAKGTRLNPDWVEWLMGWPIGWTSLDFINLDMKRWWNYSMITEPARYWEEDPADIPVGEKYHTPRLTSKKEYRVDRLRCCGNGQVPQQVILALKMLP
jgi:hypothetical protein